MATPGPLAINAATFSGFETAGFAGAFAATLGVVLPSFFILVVICVKFLNKYQEHNLVKGAFFGHKTCGRGNGAGRVCPHRPLFAFAGSISDINSIWQVTEIVKSYTCYHGGAYVLLAKKFRINAITLMIIMGAAGSFPVQLINTEEKR